MKNITTVKEARSYAKNKFLASQLLTKNDYNENSAFLDADILLSHILKKNRAWILSHFDEDFSAHTENFLKLVEERKNGLPIAYITGVKEFYGRNFFVNPSVLIPKPDTEILVQEALYEVKIRLFSILAFNEIDKISSDSSSDTDSDCLLNFINEETSILDICTGSGCIGISLLAELSSVLRSTDNLESFLPRINLVLADISSEALSICKKNAHSLLTSDILNNVFIKELDLRCDDFALNDDVSCTEKTKKITKYDIITANPPYVPTKMTDSLLADGRSEPRLALDGGVDGLELIPALAGKIKQALSENGSAFVEVGEYHAEKATEIFKNAGFSNVDIIKDLNGMPRVLKIQH